MDSMRFLFRGITIDSRTEAYITKRLRTVEKMLNGEESRFEVEIEMDKKGKFRVEVMIKMPGRLYRAEETTQSVEGSVDMVESELQNQIRRDKEKAMTLRMRGGRSIKKRLVLDGGARF